MGQMEQKDIKQQHVRGQLQVGECAYSSATALTHFKRVMYTLGRTGRSEKRDMKLQGWGGHILRPLPIAAPPSEHDATSPRL